MLRRVSRVFAARKSLSFRRISTSNVLLGSNWTADDQKRLDQEIQAELEKIDVSLKSSLSKGDYNTMVGEIRKMVTANFRSNQGTVFYSLCKNFPSYNLKYFADSFFRFPPFTNTVKTLLKSLML